MLLVCHATITKQSAPDAALLLPCCPCRLSRLLWLMLGCVEGTCWAYSGATCDWASRHAGVSLRADIQKTHCCLARARERGRVNERTVNGPQDALRRLCCAQQKHSMLHAQR